MHLKTGFYSRVSGKHRRGKAHFLHIGKTGGTAIKHSLSASRAAGDYHILLHRHSKRLDQVPRGDKVFFFLRDPLKRFVSGFCSRRRAGRPRYWSPWSRAEARVFAVFSTPSELAEGLDDKDGRRRESAESAMKAIYHVNMSVWYWLGNMDYFASRLEDILYIGFQETLESDFEMLVAALGLSGGLRLPADPVRAHKTTYSPHNSLSERAVRNLNAYYADDIRFIDHARSVLQGHVGPQAGLEERKSAILRLGETP